MKGTDNQQGVNCNVLGEANQIRFFCKFSEFYEAKFAEAKFRDDP